MNVRVKLFAIAAQLAGTSETEVPLDAPFTVAQLRRALAEVSPELAGVLPQTRFAVNAEFASDAAVVSPDAEIACIPPVSGG